MKKGLIVILAAALAVGLGLGGLSLTNNMKSTKQFLADGYILDPSDEETVTTDVDAQYYFAQGDKYKEKFGNQIMFKDASSGEKEALDTNHFVHYNDGFLGSFTKGVIMDISDMSTDETYGYYSLTKNTILTKSGNSYEMTSRGESMALTEFVWKISDNDYMLVSPSITLDVGPEEVTFSDYAQITYVDGGIVRISHQTGSYQTVAADSELVTEQGAELNLVGKSFMVDGDPVFSLDDMAIDDDSYIDIDENVEDAPSIPTFNVINGKDGASGTDGAEGEEGQQGEEGKEGEEGSEGAQGSAGGEGTMGSEGAMGDDGIEGDPGNPGSKGAKGQNGKNAETAATASTISSVALNARPTITMNPLSGASDDSYNVTANSATFSLKMDADSNVIDSGSTKIEIYERDTMKLVATKSGSGLESGNTYNFTVGDIASERLKADTEYVMVVSGAYQVDPNDTGSVITQDYFRKVFKTSTAGISLEKKEVTDTSIETTATVDATASISSYKVIFYYKDGETEKVIASYSYGGTTQDSLVDDSHPTVGSTECGEYYAQTPFSAADPIPSNTTFYAKLSNVLDSKNNPIDVTGSDIELRTLKQTPYKKGSDPKVEIPAMQTSLNTSEKNHSITLSLDDIADPDMGIIGYKYELYRQNDVTGATDLTSISPVYTDESTELVAKTFKLPDDDVINYVGRIVAVFNDNEKTRELPAQLSTPSSLAAANNDLSVVFTNMNPVSGKMDEIEGDLIITDHSTDHKLLLGNVSGTYPLILTVTGEYNEVINLKFNSMAVGATASTTYEITNSSSSKVPGATANVSSVDSDVTTIHFQVKGLRKNVVYTVAAIGPENDDLDSTLVASEQNTYLAGIRTTTADATPISLVAVKMNKATSAFTFGINLTSMSDSDADTNAAQYETNIMENLVLELIHNKVDGSSKVIGTGQLLDYDSAIQDSTFRKETYLPRSQATVNSDSSLTVEKASAHMGSQYPDEYVLTPSTFGLENQLEEFYTGGTFQIRVKQATDYTVHKNQIPFKEGEDVINFEIKEKHTQAVDPNTQVEVTQIPNSGAAAAYKDSSVGDDTTVGIRLEAQYLYSDIGNIEYMIYEIDENNTTATTKDIDGYTEGATTIPSRFIYSTNSGLYTGDRDDANKVAGKDLKLTPVLKLTRVADDADRSTMPLEIYFNGTKCSDDTVTVKKIVSGAEQDIAEGDKILSRGKRYIVTYQVNSPTTHTGVGAYNCSHTDRAYPYCAYDADMVNVPYYRSAVVELRKQMPVVERYPYSSDASSDTWKYRFVDPDGALATDASNQVTATIGNDASYETSKTATTSTVKITVPTTDTEFVNVTVTASASKYYTVRIPYTVLDAETNNEIASKPVKKSGIESFSVNSSDIRLQGKSLSDDDTTVPEGDKVDIGGKKYETALVNEGNYRYRINLRGNGLEKVTALKVTLTDTTNASNVITYEPVYLAYINNITEGGTTEKIAYAYIDASPLANDTFKNKTVKVEVEAYYSTKANGFGDLGDNTNPGYKSVKENFTDKNLSGENLYAIRRYNPDSESDISTYRVLSNNSWAIADTEGRTKNSIFVPGSSKGSGLTVTPVAGGASEVSMSQRYPSDAIVTATDSTMFQSKTEAMYLDATGIHSGSDYYTVEKLSLSGKLTVKQNSDNIYVETTIGEIMPAIEKDKISAGATSAYFKMNMIGSAATSSSKVYATLARVNGTTIEYLKLEKKTTPAPSSEVYYEVVKEAGNPQTSDSIDTYYNYSDFNGSNIPLSSDGKTAELTIRGLSTNTKYQIVFFTYDATSTHNIKTLYSLDGKRVGYPYEITTLSEVTLTMPTPYASYVSYNNKKYNFGAAVSGSDGVNIAIKYSIYNVTDSTYVISNQLIMPNGTEEYYYYSQDWNNNNKYSLTYNPRGGQLVYGKTYKVILEAFDASKGLSQLGDRVGYNDTVTFATTSALADPSFYIEPSSTADSITARITCTDEQRSIMDDSEQNGNGKYTAKLYDSNDEKIGEETVELNMAEGETSQVSTVTWSSLSSTSGEYYIKVEAPVDNNNDGEEDKKVTEEMPVSKSSFATATLGATITASEISVKLSKTSNFKDNVKKVILSVFDSSGKRVYNVVEETAENFVTSDPGSFEITKSWGTTTAGDYTIQTQYQNDAGKKLGTSEITVTVK